jgi:antitoxin component of MazEF toxin-antitoxin module
MTQATIGRWGKNLAVRFPADIAKAAGLDDGQRVDIVSQNDALVIRKLPSELTIESMFETKPPGEWRKLYRDAFDWGEDRGQEQVEE